MADLTHESLAVHAVEDVEHNTVTIVADYDGVLIPLTQFSLGHKDSIKAAAENDIHPGINTPVTAPSKANGDSKTKTTK